MSNIVTGEKIQQLCDIYLGIKGDFRFNPLIGRDTEKHIYLNNINDEFNNPYRVFCYGHNINMLSQKIHLFKNNFILVTHNSDEEIRETIEVNTILNCEKVLKWFGQNICFDHTKLNFLPIGIANSQWAHGNLSLFYDNNFMQNLSIKTNKIYFNFNIKTNVTKRQLCYDSLKNKLEWLDNVSPLENLKRLSSYEFCICPEGNGGDTHRLWECLYLKVVPIVIESEFTKTLLKTGIPMVILDKWDNIDVNSLNYNDFNFENEKNVKILNFAHFQNLFQM
jgi:hypothetical protein